MRALSDPTAPVGGLARNPVALSRGRKNCRLCACVPLPTRDKFDHLPALASGEHGGVPATVGVLVLVVVIFPSVADVATQMKRLRRPSVPVGDAHDGVLVVFGASAVSNDASVSIVVGETLLVESNSAHVHPRRAGGRLCAIERGTPPSVSISSRSDPHRARSRRSA